MSALPSWGWTRRGSVQVSTTALRDRIGELEAQVALLTRDCELMGTCNDRLREQLDRERLASATEIKALIMQRNHLTLAWYATQRWRS